MYNEIKKRVQLWPTPHEFVVWTSGFLLPIHWICLSKKDNSWFVPLIVCNIFASMNEVNICVSFCKISEAHVKLRSKLPVFQEKRPGIANDFPAVRIKKKLCQSLC